MTEDDKIVPFGKYEGQPVTRLVEDDDYAEWLTSQPWFRQKFGDLYQIVLNYGAEPQDTPEHNEMQAKFLDDDWCLALARTIYGDDFHVQPSEITVPGNDQQMIERFDNCLYGPQREQANVTERSFETKGWDIFLTVAPAYIEYEIVDTPCDCRDSAYSSPRWHDDDCLMSNSDIYSWFCRHPVHKTPQVHEFKRWQGSSHDVYVECKPTIGDDFPSVMRQVKRYDTQRDWHSVVVLARSVQSETVTVNEIREMFSESKIKLLLTRDVKENLPNP